MFKTFTFKVYSTIILQNNPMRLGIVAVWKKMAPTVTLLGVALWKKCVSVGAGFEVSFVQSSLSGTFG